MTRIKNPSLSWTPENAPFSQDFGDIYYNLKDGLAETSLVFLGGNNLPDSWRDKHQFTIAETGFGTGLNFLAAWKMFEETAAPHQRLDFISVEQAPLHKDDLQRALQNWHDRIGQTYCDRLVEVYPSRTPGFHRRWISDRITLTLIFDDALRALTQLQATVDAWFLDGFSPKKNPQIWQEALYAQMARLSVNGTTMASFTAASAVKNGLKNAGFAIKRHDGFGYKYHRITGIFESDKKRMDMTPPEHVNIIGTGLAGAATAHALKRRGIGVTLFEREKTIGNGASGNTLGLINPKIEAQDNPRNDAGLSAFSFASHVLSDLPEIDYRRTGALHLAVGDKGERLKRIFAHHDWLAPHMRWVDAAEAKEICGIDVAHDGLFYADAGIVNTRKLVATLLHGHAVQTNRSVLMPIALSDPLILCAGWGLHDFDVTEHLPLQPVRGQVTTITSQGDLKCPVMFGSYIAPTTDGSWSVGATFQQNDDDTFARTEDDATNIAQLAELLGHTIPSENILYHWSGVRTASRDRFPIVGKLPKQDQLYLSGALGSHGIQFSLLLGEILACAMTNAPMPVGMDALNALSIERF